VPINILKESKSPPGGCVSCAQRSVPITKARTHVPQLARCWALVTSRYLPSQRLGKLQAELPLAPFTQLHAECLAWLGAAAALPQSGISFVTQRPRQQDLQSEVINMFLRNLVLGVTPNPGWKGGSFFFIPGFSAEWKHRRGSDST
jgi:hypothetical protein